MKENEYCLKTNIAVHIIMWAAAAPITFLLIKNVQFHLIPSGIFKIEDSAHVARLWGLRKNRPAMNYDKLSRSIRQYYKKGIIRKPDVSQRLVYQFVHPVWISDTPGSYDWNQQQQINTFSTCWAWHSNVSGDMYCVKAYLCTGPEKETNMYSCIVFCVFLQENEAMTNFKKRKLNKMKYIDALHFHLHVLPAYIFPLCVLFNQLYRLYKCSRKIKLPLHYICYVSFFILLVWLLVFPCHSCWCAWHCFCSSLGLALALK